MRAIWALMLLACAAVIGPAAAQSGTAGELAAVEARATARGAVLGNPNGATVLFEFFDYNCGYCRAAFPDLVRLTHDYPDLKIVLVEWPILGADSVESAHEALRYSGPGYLATVRAVMTGGGRATADRITNEASRAGARVAEQDLTPAREVSANNTLANRLGMRGAPGFYINGVVSTGMDSSILRGICGYSGRGSCREYVVLLADAREEKANGSVANVDRFLRGAVADAQRLSSSEALNEVCWAGGLLDSAPSVMAACTAAVAAAPTNADYRDSRGLARALTGDRAGAIADFQYFIARNARAASSERRRRVIALLQGSTPPVNNEIIALLRD